MNKSHIEGMKIDNEEMLKDPEEFIDKFGFSIFDEKARSAINLAREIEQDSLTMMEKGFLMTQQIYDAELATNDHLTGLAKFFISISATGIFAAVGLNVVNIQAYLLYVLALPVLVMSTVTLAVLFRRRNKVIKKRTDDYQKVSETMELVTNASKMRLKAMQSIKNDDPIKMQEMFKELGIDLKINPVDLKKTKNQ
ncbi:MAG: hypothetical protein ABIQ04_02720 [Candidatus Saccharimonadales bacterium]